MQSETCPNIYSFNGLRLKNQKITILSLSPEGSEWFLVSSILTRLGIHSSHCTPGAGSQSLENNPVPSFLASQLPLLLRSYLDTTPLVFRKGKLVFALIERKICEQMFRSGNSRPVKIQWSQFESFQIFVLLKKPEKNTEIRHLLSKP